MNATHLHLMLNHAPALGIFFGLVVFGYGLTRNNDEIKRVALWLFLLSAALVLPVYFSGAPAMRAMKLVAGIDHLTMGRHQEMAFFALGTMILLAAASVLALTLIRRRNCLPAAMAAVVLVFSLATLGLMTWTSHQGGEIHHREIHRLE